MNRMIKVIALLGVTVGLAVSFGCSGASYMPQHSDSARPTVNINSASPTSDDNEALNYGKTSITDKYLAKCGDSYYSRSKEEDMMDPPHTVRTYEFKDGNFTVADTKTVTEADKLNGVAWSGRIKFQFTAQRYFTIGHGWSDWQTPESRSLVWTFTLTKQNGQWSMKPEAGKLEHYYKPDCSSVPQ